jgi:hypothetical protein
MTREQKIALAEMRASGVRGLIVYCVRTWQSLTTGREAPPS